MESTQADKRGTTRGNLQAITIGGSLCIINKHDRIIAEFTGKRAKTISAAVNRAIRETVGGINK
jgi:hypothetical protein